MVANIIPEEIIADPYQFVHNVLQRYTVLLGRLEAHGGGGWGHLFDVELGDATEDLGAVLEELFEVHVEVDAVEDLGVAF